MPSLLAQHELERRLLAWTASAFVPRYPFFEGPPQDYSQYSASATHHLSSGRMQDLNRWFNDIELAAQDCDVAVEQYPDVAIYFLRGDLKAVMYHRRDVYLKATRRAYWEWRDFQEDLTRIIEETQSLMAAAMFDRFSVLAEGAKKIIKSSQVSGFASDAVEQLRRAHPYIASSIQLGLVIGGAVVLLPALGVKAWDKYWGKEVDSGESRGPR